jgi:GNAT superfamily N-acetyltransferase
MLGKNKIMLRIFIYIAMLGAVLGCIADVCLLYAPQAKYELMDYRFLLDISPNSLLWGHYLGIIGIPLEGLGLWVLVRGMWQGRAIAKTLIMFVLAWVLLVGVVYHTAIVWAGSWLRAGQDIEAVRHFFEPLGSGLAVLFLGLALPFLWLVAKGKTQYSRRLLWFNPITTYILAILLYVVLPNVGRYTAVAGFNMAIFILFLGLLGEKAAFDANTDNE